MTNRNGDTVVYNPLNKPAILTNHKTGAEVRFYYGVGGKRYLKTTQNVDTYYLGKSYEERVEGSQETQICYISIGGKTIGTHTQVFNTDYVPTNANYAETPFNRYFHTDALGSITAITDDNATVVERRSYEAFGKIRAMDYGVNNNSLTSNLTIVSNRAFTGHEQISEIPGLIHMNARVYDSDIGRFLSADSIVQDPLDSQAFNRYSYVRNNPMMFTDPSGHSWLSKKWKKFKKWVKRKWRKIVGGVLVIAGVVVGFTPFAWASKPLIATGTSLIHYDPSRPESRSNQVTVSVGGTIPINTTGGSSGKNPAEQEEQLDAIQDEEIARAETLSGTQNNMGASSDNSKYANGAGTRSYGNTEAASTTNSNGEVTLRPIVVTATSLPKGYEWIGDLPSYAYTAFTFTSVGGVYDVLVQYDNGEIGGWYAAGLLGANALGGKVGGKAYRYGFSKTEELFIHFEKHGGDIMKGLNRTDYNINNYLDDANYVIRNGQYLPEMNGYVNFMGKDGKANYGFVGMTRDGKNITTFGVRNANGLKGL